MEVDQTEPEKRLRSLRPSLLSILTREAKKEKLAYKIAAIDAAARVFEAWRAHDQFLPLAATTLERLTKSEDDDDAENCANGGNAMDHDGLQHPPKTKSAERIRFEEVALESLGRAFPDERPTDADALRVTQETVDVLAERMGVAHVWKIQLAALKGTLLVVKHAWLLGSGRTAEVETVLKALLAPVCHHLANKKYVALRKTAVDVLDQVLNGRLCLSAHADVLAVAWTPLAEMGTDANVELQKKSGELLRLLPKRV